jgi:uncharacterized protein
MTTIETSTKHCPSCDAQLVGVERSGIHIDACPRCRGVWLDRGELDRIVERERGAGEPELDADFLAEMQGRGPGTPPRDHDERRGGKRRGSFLEELFDFGG